MKEGYDLLPLTVDNSSVQSTKSVRRSWNQLPRLQRNLICMLVIGAFIYCIYFYATNKTISLELQRELDALADVPRPDSLITSQTNVLELDMKREDNVVIVQNIKKPKVNKNNFHHQNKMNESHESTLKSLMKPSIKEELVNSDEELSERQKAVVAAFRHAWAGYKQFAWGHDHLKPISKAYQDWFGLGLTIVDALDTMYILGLKQEFEEASSWVNSEMDMNRFSDVNLFEVTIRVLGGLLSAFHLSSNQMFLNKAINLGERLMPCFTKSPSPIPYSDVNLASHLAHAPRWSPDSSTSEVTTIQLEFRDLARASKKSKFEEVASRVSEHVHTLEKKDGLVPVFINPKTGLFQPYSDIKLGARGDSYYEYLLKQWIQTGKTINYLRDDYLDAIQGIKKHLVRETPVQKLLYIGELKGGSRDFVPKMDHLVCYLPGTLALGHHNGLPVEHMRLAERLMETCYATYSQRPTFLAPEISYFRLKDEGDDDIYVNANDAHNLLRPEFVESLWYMYQITGNKTYQNWGWTIFQAFEKYTKFEHGYSSIGNVNNKDDVRPKDMMESFFLGETLKYFYLLFSNNRYLVNLDNFIVNTEAHLLPIYSS